MTSRERLRALARYLQAGREEERTRIAHELQDDFGQALTGIKLALERSAREQSGGTSANFTQPLGLVNELIRRMRDLSLELRPAMLDDLGLLAALQWHVDRYTGQFKVAVDFKQTRLEGRRFSAEIETAVYRTVQEALTNVVCHAQVGKVSLKINADQERLRIQIKNQGVGSDPQSQSDARDSGLSGMRERAIALGGRLSLESASARGSSIEVELPLRFGASVDALSLVKSRKKAR